MKNLIFILPLILLSCTENTRVKKFGGEGHLKISEHQKFQNVTWKGGELWVLTKDRSSSDTTYSTYRFQEHSNWGMLEGTFVIEESRPE